MRSLTINNAENVSSFARMKSDAQRSPDTIIAFMRFFWFHKGLTHPEAATGWATPRAVEAFGCKIVSKKKSLAGLREGQRTGRPQHG